MANNIIQPVIVKAVWDISVSGNLATNASHSATTPVIIPEGALITRAWTFCETAITDDGDNSTTLALGYTGATGAFIAAVACNTVQYAAGIGTTLVD